MATISRDKAAAALPADRPNAMQERARPADTGLIADKIVKTDSSRSIRKIEIFSQVRGKPRSISERTLILQRTPSEFTIEAVAGLGPRGEDMTHGNPLCFFRENDNAEVRQTLTTRGRADDDLPDAPVLQRMYADGWVCQRTLVLCHFLEGAARSACPGLPEPVDGRQTLGR